MQRSKQTAVSQCKNQAKNVEKTRLNWASFLKRNQLQTTKISKANHHAKAASNLLVFNIPHVHGVCVFQ